MSSWWLSTPDPAGPHQTAGATFTTRPQPSAAGHRMCHYISAVLPGSADLGALAGVLARPGPALKP